MEGSILDVFKAYEQGVDLISEHEASQAQDQPVTLTGPQEQREGLRPFHAAGDVKRSAVFKDVPPNTPFNTNGMRVPIDIEKYDRQGHLVESHKSVPPGVRNLPTGPHRGDIIETPSEGYRDGGFLQKGGARKDEDYNMKRALELGYKPDEDGHYPSVDHETGMLLKSKQHPTVKLEFMSQMLSPERKMVANPTGYFGDYQLQYVDRKKKGGAKDPVVGTGKKPKGSGRRLYTDENPKDTVGIKFATPADARATVSKVKNINKPFARKIQILTVGEQRAKVMGKDKVVSIFNRAKESLRARNKKFLKRK